MRDTQRPSWDEYFLKLAFEVSKRSTCLRRAVGAIIVKDRRILATGYNGVPSGLRHCEETGCLREQLGVPSGQRHEICRGLHAEQNAIIQAARYGIDIEGSSISSPPSRARCVRRCSSMQALRRLCSPPRIPINSPKSCSAKLISSFAALNTPNNARYSSAWALFTCRLRVFFNF